MSKAAPLSSVLTANRLGDGIVVFLGLEGAWSESLAEAVVARSPDEVKALEDRGACDAARNLVVDPYLVEVRETAGQLTPIRYRERVRAAGPSISPSPRSSRGEGWGLPSAKAEGEGQPQAPTQAEAA
jgi:hypothetical protein